MNTDKISSQKINQLGSAIANAAEDHALVSVPMAERQSGFKLAMSPVGVATALVIFAIGGFTVLLAGFWTGLLAGFIATLIGFTLSYFLGQMTFQTGMSSTVTSRFFGFGVKGSSLGAAIFAFMILGFLALESALLYEGTLLMFDLPDSMLVRILLYGALTLAWILLAIFGLQIALKASKFMIVITLIVTFYMIYQIYVVGGMDPMQVFNSTGLVPGGFWAKLSTALVLMGATAGTIALVTTDFARYCRHSQDVKVLAMAGPITQNLLMIVLGGLVIIGGVPEVAEYLMQRNAGLSPQQAAEAAGGFAMSNTGAFFVVLAGWLGFITIYAAQAKAQAVNAYSGSLALVNLLDALTGKKPGRAFMVVVKKGHPLVNKENITWTDLSEFPMVLPPEFATTRNVIEEFLLFNQVNLSRRYVESLSTLTNIGVLQQTESIGFLSGQVAEYFKKANLVDVLPLTMKNIYIDIGLVWYAERNLTPSQLSIISMLEETVNQNILK